MVLTNFECWAHGEEIGAMWNAHAVIERRNAPHVDFFNPNSAAEECGEVDPPKFVSHLSSNGYYGFAPICHPVTETTTTLPKVPHQQHEQESAFSNIAAGEFQMMDVEQHRPEMVDLNNRFNARRKRIFVEEECFQVHRRDAKRCRFDRQREEYCAENNNGFCDSTFTPNAFQTMEHDELPLAISSQSTDMESSNRSSKQNNIPANITENPTEIEKSNFSCNKYSDISRCMLSHMI